MEHINYYDMDNTTLYNRLTALENNQLYNKLKEMERAHDILKKMNEKKLYLEKRANDYKNRIRVVPTYNMQEENKQYTELLEKIEEHTYNINNNNRIYEMIHQILDDRNIIKQEEEGEEKIAPTIHSETLQSSVEEYMQSAPDPVTVDPRTLSYEDVQKGAELLRWGIVRYKTTKQKLDKLQEKSESTLTEQEKKTRKNNIYKMLRIILNGTIKHNRVFVIMKHEKKN